MNGILDAGLMVSSEALAARLTAVEHAGRAARERAEALVRDLRVAQTREGVMQTLLDVREQRILALERALERERRLADEATRWAARAERRLAIREDGDEVAPVPVVRRRRGVLALRRVG